jgi:hypothetical protein
LYRIDTDSAALDQIAALPVEALAHYVQVLGVLKLVPWNGMPYNERKPDGIMRTLPFGDGRGKVTYLIMEEQLRVDVLKVMWFG